MISGATRALLAAFVAAASLVPASKALAADCGNVGGVPGTGTPCGCGDTVTSDYTLTADLDCPSSFTGIVLTIATDGIVLDGGNHTITAPAAGRGVLVFGASPTVKNLNVVGPARGFNSGSGSNHTFSNVTASGCQFGMLLEGSGPVVTGSAFGNNAAADIYLGGSPPAPNAVIELTDICSTGISRDGVDATDNTGLVATNLWWGDPSGPYNASLHPSGLGAEIIGRYVTAATYTPWRTTGPYGNHAFCPAPPDADGDGTPDSSDGCPNDPNKIAAGQCGCGVAETDTDGDGSANCVDLCPTDAGQSSARVGLVRLLPNQFGPTLGVAEDPTTGNLFFAFASYSPSATIRVVNATTGATLVEFTPPAPPLGQIGLDFVTVPFNIGGTSVAANTLLIGADIPGYTKKRVFAVDKDTGATLGSIDLPPSPGASVLSGGGLAYHNARGTVFFVDDFLERVTEYNLATGAVVQSFSVSPPGHTGMAFNYSGGDINQNTGNIYVTGGSFKIRELSPDRNPASNPADDDHFVRDFPDPGGYTGGLSDLSYNESTGLLWTASFLSPMPPLLSMGPTDADGDGALDCNDSCPNDPAKIASAGQCGCGTAESYAGSACTTSNLGPCAAGTGSCSGGSHQCVQTYTAAANDATCDGIDDDCNGAADEDAPDPDGDGVACGDACPNDPAKSASAGVCGCGAADADPDGDGIASCADACPDTADVTTTLADGRNNPQMIAVDGANVYWTEYGAVLKRPIGGGTITTLSADDGYHFGLAIDAGFVYFTSYNHSSVFKMSKAGGAVTTLFNAATSPRDIAVDGSSVYWIDNGSGRIMSVSKNNPDPSSGASTLATGVPGNFARLALDSSAIYWTEVSGGGAVKKVPKSGGDVVTFVGSAGYPWAIAVYGDTVYWGDYYNGVRRAPTSGTVAPTLLAAAGPRTEPYYGLAVDGTRVYWTNYYKGNVQSVPIGGGPSTIVASGLGALQSNGTHRGPGDIAVDCNAVYWTIQEFAPAGQVQVHAPKSADNCTQLATCAQCGNGLVEAGEECDGGECCSAGCTFQTAGSTCGAAGTECSGPDTCDGAGHCQANDMASGTPCGDSDSACVNQDTCDGSGGCTDHGFKSASTACGDATDDACNPADHCSGNDGNCVTVFAPASTVCHPSGGVCDPAETCDGAGHCPSDAKSTAVCRAAAGVCDVAESCDGVGDACPIDLKSHAECRPAADVCDLAESCDGEGNECPGNSFAAAGAPCEFPGDDVCPNADTCDGAGACLANDDYSNADGDALLACVDNCAAVDNPGQLNTDGDALGDACDTDDDNDAVEDIADNCPLIPNLDQLASDNDGTGDACDDDDDGDGVPDVADNCPITQNAGQVDTDGDGQGAACDPDDDNDGVIDATDNCPLLANYDQANNDGDPRGDACDPDDDNDAFPDESDNCAFVAQLDQLDTDLDGTGDACDGDDDGDTVLDVDDNCPVDPNTDQANNDLADEGDDPEGDACDDDDDNDGVLDVTDDCQFVANPAVDGVQADLDSDGIGDECDGDLDGDDLVNAADNCPSVYNPGGADNDSDGLGDACDDDDDNDGALDAAPDNCPLTANGPLAGDDDQADNDGDGQGDACDADDDNDGVLDGTDNCPFDANDLQTNSDGDGEGDACDLDDDNDGHLDTGDNCPLVANAGQANNDHDGQGDACDADDDNDGVNDNAPDNCPFAANADQANMDQDGLGDACDADADGDAVVDVIDNCPGVGNPGQSDTDGDGQGDACDGDVDGDGVVNALDNCPLVANDQSDLDGDGQGDACDGDIDGDGIANGSDNCALVANAGQGDFDQDGAGDVCDGDDDNDGVPDAGDNCPLAANMGQADADGDHQGDACDADDDNDGAPDAVDNCPLVGNPGQTDTDGDGQGNACDGDDDNDGVLDGADNCPTVVNADQSDAESDGIGDACDGDDDNDGVSDAVDQCPGTPVDPPSDPDTCSGYRDDHPDHRGGDDGDDDGHYSHDHEHGEGANDVPLDPATGCSLDQLCPCSGPRGTTLDWKNHGAYVSCVTQTTNDLKKRRLISSDQREELVEEAAQSECGRSACNGKSLKNQPSSGAPYLVVKLAGYQRWGSIPPTTAQVYAGTTRVTANASGEFIIPLVASNGTVIVDALEPSNVKGSTALPRGAFVVLRRGQGDLVVVQKGFYPSGSKTAMDLTVRVVNGAIGGYKNLTFEGQGNGFGILGRAGEDEFFHGGLVLHVLSTVTSAADMMSFSACR